MTSKDEYFFGDLIYDEDDFDDEYEEYNEDGYKCYEVEVKEIATKYVKILAKNEVDAKSYLEECLSDFDMSKDIDEYEKVVGEAYEIDYTEGITVPEWWGKV